MRLAKLALLKLAVTATLLTACSSAQTRPPITEGISVTLADVVEQEMIPFRGYAFPPEMLTWLRANRVVMLGEVHGVVEHEELVLALLKELQSTGLRHLLLEGPQAESWLTDQYVLGKITVLPPLAEKYMRSLLAPLREFNNTLLDDQKVHVHQIDINHADWAFPSALAMMRTAGLSHPSVSTFLNAIGTASSTGKNFSAWRKENSKTYLDLLAKLNEKLSVAEPGKSRDTILTMVEVAQESLKIRNIWDTEGENAAHPRREKTIISLVENLLELEPGPVLINMGGFHAQLEHVMGTPKVWVAEHLQKVSAQAKGSVASVYVALARQQAGERVLFDVSDTPEPGELFALINTLTTDSNVYLPLEHKRFGMAPIPVNYLGQVVHHSPQNQFGAYILLRSGQMRER